MNFGESDNQPEIIGLETLSFLEVLSLPKKLHYFEIGTK